MTATNQIRFNRPLITAVLARDPIRLRAAIEAGGDVNERDKDGRTPLHHACIENDQTIVDLLLASKADVAPVDNDGWTPLHFAARNHHVEIVRTLLQSGSPVDVIDSHGNTPLFRAVFESRGRGDTIEVLLRAGADKNRKNNHDMSPADLAATIANFDVKQWLR
jgi:ankyrin repeat protein